MDKVLSYKDSIERARNRKFSLIMDGATQFDPKLMDHIEKDILDPVYKDHEFDNIYKLVPYIHPITDNLNSAGIFWEYPKIRLDLEENQDPRLYIEDEYYDRVIDFSIENLKSILQKAKKLIFAYEEMIAGTTIEN